MFNRLHRIEAAPAAGLKLTQRELECLRWSREGKTSWEIAHILGISQSTIIFHMKNAVAKLGAANKTQAVIAAIERGLIS